MLPAGIAVDDAALAELRAEHVIEAYDIRGRRVAISWPELAAGESSELRLRALPESRGRFTAPASTCRLPRSAGVLSK